MKGIHFRSLLALLPLALQINAALREFELDMVISEGSLDGGPSRKMYMFNGVHPGPEIVVDQGDEVRVVVHNNMDTETAIHWHGVEQKGTPFYDGVPGVSQNMIHPGQSFTYHFTATEAGAYWYHGHSRVIYNDGLRGLLYIRPANIDHYTEAWRTITTDEHELQQIAEAHCKYQWLTIADWNHHGAEEVMAEWQRTNIEQICEDSIIINGKGQVYCQPQEFLSQFVNPFIDEYTPKGCALPSNVNIHGPTAPNFADTVDPDVFFNCNPTEAPVEVIHVDPEAGFASLAILNWGGDWELRVSIDAHKFWVYAADGQLMTPQEVDVISVPIGERYQVLIKLDQEHRDYVIRVASALPLGMPQILGGFAILSYGQPRNDYAPTGNQLPPDVNPKLGYAGNLSDDAVELVHFSLKPYPAFPPPQGPATVTHVFNISRPDEITWVLNTDPWLAFRELEQPLLYNASHAADFPPTLVMPNAPIGSVVDLVFAAVAGQPAHPVHKHGRKAWIIGAGNATWVWNNVEEAQAANPQFFNLVDPPHRDGWNTIPSLTGQPSFVVVRYEVTETFATMIHCHILMHQASGMSVALLDGMENVQNIVLPDPHTGLFDQPAEHRRRSRDTL